jgi:hypothetical protein
MYHIEVASQGDRYGIRDAQNHEGYINTPEPGLGPNTRTVALMNEAANEASLLTATHVMTNEFHRVLTYWGKALGADFEDSSDLFWECCALAILRAGGHPMAWAIEEAMPTPEVKELLKGP